MNPAPATLGGSGTPGPVSDEARADGLAAGAAGLGAAGPGAAGLGAAGPGAAGLGAAAPAGLGQAPGAAAEGTKEGGTG